MRQRLFLYAVSEMRRQHKKVTKTILDKILFVALKETNIGGIGSFYHFYPHNYGPFSNTFYYELSDAMSRGFLDENLEPSISCINEIEKISDGEKKAISSVIQRFDGNSVINYVYEHYPEYTKRSVLKERTNAPKSPGIFSIGYEKKDIDFFLDILIQNEIQTVVDVRANPFSMNFSFTKKKLENSLNKVGIEYVHFPDLGITSEKRKGLDTEEDYSKLFDFYRKEILPKRRELLLELARIGSEKRIALLCFEMDHKHCHRGVISDSLEANSNTQVTHL